MTRSYPASRSVVLLSVIVLSFKTGASLAAEGTEIAVDFPAASASRESNPSPVDAMNQPQPNPVVITPSAKLSPETAVKQEPAMAARTSLQAHTNARNSAIAGRPAPVVPLEQTSTAAHAAASSHVAQTREAVQKDSAGADLASPTHRGAAPEAGTEAGAHVTTVPISRPSTLELATMEAVGYAAGAVLLGSATTLAGLSMVGWRRRKVPKTAGPSVSDPTFSESATHAHLDSGRQPVAMPVAMLQPAARLTASAPSLEQQCQVAERWCQAKTVEPGLLVPLNLPGRLDSLHGTRAGMVSVAGPVRERNEDACLLLQLDNGATVLMAADGMGGHPDGHLASRLALVGACVGLREGLQRSTDVSEERLLQHAFVRARRLLRRATHTGRLKRDAGTTLILTLVTSDHYVTAYLGDGGAYVRRVDGRIEALMLPQKTESVRLNRFLAADAPLNWRPELTRIARRRQDMLAIGSDGVMDRVDIGEVLNWLAGVVATKGLSMSRALYELVSHHSTLVHSDGSAVADDNMTLVAIHMR